MRGILFGKGCDPLVKRSHDLLNIRGQRQIWRWSSGRTPYFIFLICILPYFVAVLNRAHFGPNAICKKPLDEVWAPSGSYWPEKCLTPSSDVILLWKRVWLTKCFYSEANLVLVILVGHHSLYSSFAYFHTQQGAIWSKCSNEELCEWNLSTLTKLLIFSTKFGYGNK